MKRLWCWLVSEHWSATQRYHERKIETKCPKCGRVMWVWPEHDYEKLAERMIESAYDLDSAEFDRQCADVPESVWHTRDARTGRTGN